MQQKQRKSGQSFQFRIKKLRYELSCFLLGPSDLGRWKILALKLSHEAESVSSENECDDDCRVSWRCPRPGQSLQLGKPLCDRKGGGTECPPSGGYRLDSGAAFVLAPPVHVCVSVQIGVCVCEQGDP